MDPTIVKLIPLIPLLLLPVLVLVGSKYHIPQPPDDKPQDPRPSQHIKGMADLAFPLQSLLVCWRSAPRSRFYTCACPAQAVPRPARPPLLRRLPQPLVSLVHRPCRWT